MSNEYGACPMVKSPRYDQKGRDNSSDDVTASRLWRAGHADSCAYCYGHSAPDSHTTPHSHVDAGVDLSCVESFSEVGST